MQALIDRIKRDGRNLGNGILKVDGFINHQVDAELMDACGAELARRFAQLGSTKILTAEDPHRVVLIDDDLVSAARDPDLAHLRRGPCRHRFAR